MQPNVIPLTPQGHFFQQLYHKTARGMSSLKTSLVKQNGRRCPAKFGILMQKNIMGEVLLAPLLNIAQVLGTK